MSENKDGLSFRRIRFKLEAAGFDEVRQLGNHAKFVKRRGPEIWTAVIPHYTEISASTLRSIIQQSGLSQKDFDAL
ncbi:MAG: type II toxin-antitoxin system HicA family toxin [Candidatus Obscuribacterales bacterium]|nr:type II toxin-antitoxin system HicA family toxin [Candidatus Obscuribacterales bacterium]